MPNVALALLLLNAAGCTTAAYRDADGLVACGGWSQLVVCVTRYRSVVIIICLHGLAAVLAMSR